VNKEGDMDTVTKLLSIPGAFLTGSRAWSERISANSDWDIAMPCSEEDIARAAMVRNGYEVTAGNYYRSLNGRSIHNNDATKIQIILLSPIELVTWFHATRAMKPLTSLLNCKINRIAIFEGLRASLKPVVFEQQWTRMPDAISSIEKHKKKGGEQ